MTCYNSPENNNRAKNYKKHLFLIIQNLLSEKYVTKIIILGDLN